MCERETVREKMCERDKSVCVRERERDRQTDIQTDRLRENV